MYNNQREYIEIEYQKMREAARLSGNDAYDITYDAYYDKRTNEWLESKCDDPNCSFCKNRPPKHL